jgi:hypothetical protein
LCVPYATLGQSERIVVRHDASASVREVHCLAVSPWKCARLLKGLNLNHRQIVEAALIRAEAIGRTEPHTEVAMKDQAERFPTVVASHGFNMRQTSALALHLRSPFPRLHKTNAKTFGGFQHRLAPSSADQRVPRMTSLTLRILSTNSIRNDQAIWLLRGHWGWKDVRGINLMSKHDEYRDSAARVFELAARA